MGAETFIIIGVLMLLESLFLLRDADPRKWPFVGFLGLVILLLDRLDLRFEDRRGIAGA